MKKNFRFIWSIWNKVLTFAPAFKMRAALFDNLFEIRAVQVAAGKALVLKDNGMFRGSIAVVSADIFAAEVDLISDTFALAGIAGLAGIDGNGVGSFGHEILLSCCPVAVDAAIVAWQAIFVKKNNDSHTYFIILRTEVSRM